CFKLDVGTQRPPTPGAVAHMSLHLINNVKDQSRKQNPDNNQSPVHHRKPKPSVAIWRPTPQHLETTKPPENRLHRIGEAAYMEGHRRRQRPFFHNPRKSNQNPRNTCVLDRNFSGFPPPTNPNHRR
ncbi:hypothetical protein, partial [Novosphingobium sp. SG720]|uniref:hypothetical protein n=1 Tax=Novosphingobium sp. SG720 TaxID=2586998 RepID=UPI001B2FFF49